MVSFRGIATVIAIYATLISISLTGESESHELRPSYHGLDYQSSAEGKKSAQEMRSFFGGSSPTSTSSNVAMPNAMDSNSTDNGTSWWTGRGSHGADHVRRVLLVASVACGVTGVALFVATTLLYIFKFRRQRSPAVPQPSSAALSCNDAALSCNDDENKLQIVVRA
ncbi:hypothetical protein I3760_09G138800 [Carya illinoinensis]|nr:hypothetical protein I3760_09G138800 [Carya illinoinensis]